MRLPLTQAVWDALSKYGGLQCLELFERMTVLPRELRDIIYEGLLEESDQRVIVDYHRSSCEKSSWWNCLAYFNDSDAGQAILSELMALYYVRSRIYLDHDLLTYEFGNKVFDFPLWSLLSDCPSGLTHPATVLNDIIISIPQQICAYKDNDMYVIENKIPELLIPPTNANKIENAKTRGVITGREYIESIALFRK